MRVANASTNASSSASGNERLTYPYNSARSPGMSSAPRSTSSACPLPIRRGSRAIGPPPGTGPDFKLRQDRFFAARETHVAGQRKLASDTRRTPSNRRDRHHRGAAQAHEHIGQRLPTCRPGRQTCRILRFCKKIVMTEKETFNGTVKDHHFDLLVGFERRDDHVQLRNGFRAENVERRVIKRDTPVSWERSRKKHLFR